MKKGTKPSFEENYKRLEEVVKLLDAGNLSLEETLALFEEGINLARECESQLDQAELRITQLDTGKDTPVEETTRLL